MTMYEFQRISMASASSLTKNMLSASPDDNSDVDDACFDAMSPVKSEELRRFHRVYTRTRNNGGNKAKLLKMQMEAKESIHVTIFHSVNEIS